MTTPTLQNDAIPMNEERELPVLEELEAWILAARHCLTKKKAQEAEDAPLSAFTLLEYAAGVKACDAALRIIHREMEKIQHIHTCTNIYGGL